VVTSTLPSCHLGNKDLKFVTEFKCLDHIITNDEHDHDDQDM